MSSKHFQKAKSKSASNSNQVPLPQEEAINEHLKKDKEVKRDGLELQNRARRLQLKLMMEERKKSSLPPCVPYLVSLSGLVSRCNNLLKGCFGY